MRSIALILAFFLAQGMSLKAGGVEIEVGDRLIEVPLPEGFVELTPEMSPYYEAMQAYIAPNNVRYLTLIRQNQAEALLRGERIQLGRYINVETEKGISAVAVSRAEFAEFQSILRDQLEEMYANLELKLPEVIDKGNATLSEQFDAEVAVELGGVVPLPIHLDSDTATANSMFMTVGSAVDGQQAGTEVLAATTLFLHVSDKVLFLYVYGAEADLDWTREAAATWAAAIVASNPLPTSGKGASESAGSIGIDWSRVLEQALLWGLIGAVVGGLVLLFNKRR